MVKPSAIHYILIRWKRGYSRWEQGGILCLFMNKRAGRGDNAGQAAESDTQTDPWHLSKSIRQVVRTVLEQV
jgi:hypothetical protein